MDDLRIGSLGLVDSFYGQTKEGSKKRSRQKYADPQAAQEELADQVTLSSAGEPEEPPAGYFPVSLDEEPK
jgi:hypothetical protein